MDRSRAPTPGVRWIVLLAALVSMAAVACASSADVRRAAGGSGGAEARQTGNHCEDGCRLIVENRLSDTDVEVSLSHLRGVDVLGRVQANNTGRFEIEHFDGHELHVWLYDARSVERIEGNHFVEIHSFPGGERRIEVGPR